MGRLLWRRVLLRRRVAADNFANVIDLILLIRRAEECPPYPELKGDSSVTFAVKRGDSNGCLFLT